MIVVWVVENDFVSVWWIGIDLVFAQRSKMTCFLRSGRKWIVFSVRIEIN